MEVARREREAGARRKRKDRKVERTIEAKPTTLVVSETSEHKVALEVTGSEAKSLLSIIETISHAQPPSNQQIEFLLQEIKKGLDEHERTAQIAGPRARRLLENLRNLIEDLQKFVAEKNKGDRLQKIINLGVETAKEARGEMPSKPEVRRRMKKAVGRQRMDTMRNEVMEILQAMKNLAIQILYSSDFRVLLLEALDLISGILHHVTEEKIKPAVEQMTEPTKGEETTEEGLGVESEKFVKESKREDPKEKQQQPETSGRANQKRRFRKGRREEKGKEFKETVEVAAEKLKEETKSLVNELASGKYTPAEQKEMVKEKFKDILIRLGQNPEYRKAIRNLFDVFGHLNKIASDVTAELKEKTEKEEFPLHDRILEMWDEIQSMIEEFSHRSLDTLVDSIRELFFLIKDDEDVSEYLTDVKIFVLSSAEHPEIIKRKNFKLGEELIERGKQLFSQEKYSGKFREVVNELKEQLYGISQDTTTQNLAEDVRQLIRDLMLDDEGKVSVSAIRESVGQLKSLLVPIIVKQFEHIPIPKIVGETPKYQYSIENMVFNGKEILPDSFFFDIVSKGSIKLKEFAAEQGRTSFKFSFKDMSTYMENVHFWFKRKKSPHYEDHGTIDLDVSGASLDVELIAETGEKDKLPWHFSAARVDCDLGNLTIYVKDAKHSFIDKVSSKVFIVPVKHTMEEKIENALLDYITRMCVHVNGVIVSAAKRTQEAVKHVQTTYTAFRPVVESA